MNMKRSNKFKWKPQSSGGKQPKAACTEKTPLSLDREILGMYVVRTRKTAVLNRNKQSQRIVQKPL